MKIFSFPHVVVYELMKQFEPVNLINLSHCSKTAHAFVKVFAKIKGELRIASCFDGAYCIDLDGEELIRFIPSTETNLAKQDKVFQDPGFHFSWFADWYTILCTCQDTTVVLRETTNYICDLFKIPVSDVFINNEEDLWVLDFAENRREQKLKEVHVLGMFSVSTESYSRILNSNTESLRCEPRPPQNYRLNGKLPAVKCLLIRDGFWITREQLLGVDSRDVLLYHTRLTSSDVNELLKLWLNGGLPNLKCLKLTRVHFDDAVYEGIQDRLERVQGEIIYKRDPADIFKPDFKFKRNVFHVRREGGVVATVEMGQEWFMMVVWPDSIGNHV